MFRVSSAFDSINCQKSTGNKIQIVEIVTGILSLPMCSNCFENTSPDWSFSKSTRTFILNSSVLTYFRKIDDFKYALRLLALALTIESFAIVDENHLPTESS